MTFFSISNKNLQDSIIQISFSTVTQKKKINGVEKCMWLWGKPLLKDMGIKVIFRYNFNYFHPLNCTMTSINTIHLKWGKGKTSLSKKVTLLLQFACKMFAFAQKRFNTNHMHQFFVDYWRISYSLNFEFGRPQIKSLVFFMTLDK